MIQTNLRRGDLVLAEFPFTDFTSTKIRPAVVVSERMIGQDVILVAVSSVTRHGAAPHDILIDDSHPEFPVTGLLKSSVIRPHHIVTVETQLMIRRLGHLPEYWQTQVDQNLKLLLGLAAP